MEIANCIVCGKKAIVWSGHVHLKDEVLLAGYCSEECEQVADRTEEAIADSRGGAKPDCEGCYGNWQERDGIYNDGFRQNLCLHDEMHQPKV